MPYRDCDVCGQMEFIVSGRICRRCASKTTKKIETLRVELSDHDLHVLHENGGNKTNGAVGRLIQSKLPANTVFKRIDSSYHSTLFQIWKLEVEVEIAATVEDEPTRRIVFDVPRG